MQINSLICWNAFIWFSVTFPSSMVAQQASSEKCYTQSLDCRHHYQSPVIGQKKQ